jgi:hypothetical protein
MQRLFDLIGNLFRKLSRSEGLVEGEDDMVSQSEISERAPWSVETLLAELDYLQPFDANDVLGALRSNPETLATALRADLPERMGKARVNAGALLLMLGDTAGREPFLAALAGPDGDARTLAVNYVRYCISPNDIDLRGAIGTSCPISSDEVFAALERDLHAPWTGLSATALEIVAWNDYPQARAVTRPLLGHPDPAIRQQIAEGYLRAGRDEGAFAAVEHVLRAAPPHLSSRDPGWQDFYHIKTIWYAIEEAALRGDSALREKAASLSMEFVVRALDAPDCASRFDVNDGLINSIHASKAIAMVMPAGGRVLLERLIGSEAVDPYDRGQALLAYTEAVGGEARPMILSALQDPALREDAARALKPLTAGGNDPRDIAALSAALDDEERPNVVATLAKALLAAGPDGQPAIEGALERSEPWAKVELYWRIGGGTDREFADLLTEAGVMDAIDDEDLSEALVNGFDVRSLIWAGGERLVTFSVKSSTGLEHFELFQNLLDAARPAIAVQDLKEVIDARVVREPISGMPRVERVTDLGTSCAISFGYLGETFGFEVHPQGRWHDVPGVMQGFDAFMQSIGRDDRCYELDGDGEWGMFVVAPASRFEPVAARLRIPIQRDPDSARDAAKAYQRQIQGMAPPVSFDP